MYVCTVRIRIPIVLYCGYKDSTKHVLHHPKICIYVYSCIRVDIQIYDTNTYPYIGIYLYTCAMHITIPRNMFCTTKNSRHELTKKNRFCGNVRSFSSTVAGTRHVPI